MNYFIQIENREDELLKRLCKSVEKQAKKFGKYVYIPNSLGIAQRIAPVNSKHPFNYSKIVLILDCVKDLKNGDIIVYLDSDVYVKTFKGLMKYIENSHKQIFMPSIFTGAVNTGIVAVKITPAIKKLFANMPTDIKKETRLNRYGEERATSDEEIFNFQIENNINGFNMYVDFLDTRRFGSIPQKEIFGSELDYLQINSKTEISHFLGEEKKIAYKYLKNK